MPTAPAKRGQRAKASQPRGDREAPKRLDSGRPKITVEVEDLTDYNESANVLVYGDSGVGKTSLAGGASASTRAGRVVFISTEKGTIAAKRTGSEAKLIRAYDWDHIEAALDWADENLGPEDWVILDSLSKMQVLLIRWILGIIHEDNEARDLDIPAIQDHQKWQNMFKRFVDRIVDAPYNAIFIATAMHATDQEGDPLVLPSITGKGYEVANYICAQMDLVMYYHAAEKRRADDPTVRRLLTQTYAKADGPVYFAKDRFHTFAAWLDVEDGEFGTMGWVIDEIMEAEPETRQEAKSASGRRGRVTAADTADATV